MGPGLDDQAGRPGAGRAAAGLAGGAAGLPAHRGVTRLSSRTALILTVLVGVVSMNAANFVDGRDGLAAGATAIGGTASFPSAYQLTRHASTTDYSSLAALITAVLIGTCLGFLPHNLTRARIFMGDSGSMLLGLLLAASTIAVTGQVDPA